ncbi:hydroxyisourate hydrolase [Alsobacter sp. KACC 23698]|uniref:Hydroxyisourate hydrolase n=1 Tax=Alsobacter sp. KACC 23698 TaxID=3149229 RepID=A0AAU7JEM2_9HYPH
MAGGISLHGVDIAKGVPATGLFVELYACGSADAERRKVAEGALGPHGALDHPVVRGEGVEAGPYECLFHLGDWMRANGYSEAEAGFMNVLPFRFVVTRIDEHYHLPLKFTPWGVSLFRGV